MKILIATTTFGRFDSTPVQLLDGLDLFFNPHGKTLSKPQICDYIQDVDGIVAGTEPLDQEVLATAKRLKVISRLGAGLDNVDIAYAKANGIDVFNTPDGPTTAVAELTVGLIMDALRHISESDQLIKHGKWEKRMGNLLSGKTVGLFGLGKIGKALVTLLAGFKIKWLAVDPVRDTEFESIHQVTVTDLDTLLASSDIISIHAPVTDQTKGCFSKSAFQKCKRGTILINTSRGELVIEEDLIEALDNGILAHAALDVYTKEPYKGPLATRRDVTLTCHIGSYAMESRIQMEIDAVKNLLKGLRRET